MTPDQKKSISRIAILGAFIMAISCTIKITAFHFNAPLVAQWVNVVMNAIVVIGCYKLGRIVQLSRSHSLLCGTAIIGYIFYGGILVFINHAKDTSISVGVLVFFALTLVMSVSLLINILLQDLKQTEKMIEEMEKEIVDNDDDI